MVDYMDKVLFFVIDTGRTGSLIIIRSGEETIYYGDQRVKQVAMNKAHSITANKRLLDQELPNIEHIKQASTDITYGKGIITGITIEEKRDIRQEYNHITGELQPVMYGRDKHTNLTIRAENPTLYEIKTDIDKIQIIAEKIAPYDVIPGHTMLTGITTYCFEEGYTTEIKRCVE